MKLLPFLIAYIAPAVAAVGLGVFALLDKIPEGQYPALILLVIVWTRLEQRVARVELKLEHVTVPAKKKEDGKDG